MSYTEWIATGIPLRAGVIRIATKPGLPAHGRDDPAALLLAGHARIEPGDVVLCLNCGNGIVGVAAAGAGAGRVVLSDRNIVAVEATRRTLALNGTAAISEVFACHGAYAIPADVVADVAVIRIPKDRTSLLQLVADSFLRLRAGGRCYLAGANAEGARTAAKILGDVFGGANTVAHGSGNRVVLATKRTLAPGTDLDGAFDDIAVAGESYNVVRAGLRDAQVTLYARPGVFSREHVDEATALLARAMRIHTGERVLDLGCGAGALGLTAALSGAGAVVMVDADVEAVRSAARGAHAAGLDGVTALPGDVASAVRDQAFDVVLTNPPFHVGKATDLDVPLQFIREARSVLRTGGRLYLVANRTLPYESVLNQCFGRFQMLVDGARFKVLEATVH